MGGVGWRQARLLAPFLVLLASSLRPSRPSPQVRHESPDRDPCPAHLCLTVDLHPGEGEEVGWHPWCPEPGLDRRVLRASLCLSRCSGNPCAPQNFLNLPRECPKFHQEPLCPSEPVLAGPSSLNANLH